MEQTLRQQAVELAEQTMRAYYCKRNIYAVLDLMAEDATWIGPAACEKIYTLDEIKIRFELCKDAVPVCDIQDCNLRAVDLSEDLCMVVGSMTISTLPESGLVLQVDQRVSFTFRYRNNKLEIVHLHNSNPYEELQADEYFPHKLGTQSYQYLQSLLKEKTEVLDMITSNINGGLKGSIDDDMYSYFYVNEGLSQMLGFTYDEFMQKTGGTAVGAVYPPDLPAALADCARCFAKGPVYSTEYRMEKKDGSLMWVLDSGRKVTDNEGITRINSIIIDISDLKQALFELGIERERYRIALEHITGAMCEYDIVKDTFTLYQQSSNTADGCLTECEITNFSEKVYGGTFSNKEDATEFLALCKGENKGNIEFLSLLPYQDGSWYWVDFSCSVISDHNGKPVRAIGIMKDITQDKEENLKLLKQAQCDALTGLLNHSTVRNTIEAYLTQAIEPTQACAVMVLDLDRFKQVNDSNGHLYGDSVLIKTARILQKAVGVSGVAGRIGGDEFLVLLKSTQIDHCESVAEKIVDSVRAIGNANNYSISCSMGIAYRKPNEPFNELFERADKALYKAKEQGKDRFYID